MERVIAGVNKIVLGCLYFLTLALVFVTGVQISLRVLFGMPLSWTEEVARYFFIWWVFFGSMLALRDRRHLAIDALVKHFPKKLLWPWEMGIHLLILGYLGTMFLMGIKLIPLQMMHRTAITDVPMGWVIAIVPICAVLMGLYTLNFMWMSWKKRKSTGM